MMVLTIRVLAIAATIAMLGTSTAQASRITIHVAGTPVQMLLDTGATEHPTVAGEKAGATPTVNGEGVTSYIKRARSGLASWHEGAVVAVGQQHVACVQVE